MQKIDTDKITSIIALVLLFIMVSLIFSALMKPSPVDDIQFLTNEMTATPVRQQRALDKLAEYDDEELICLFPYFRDDRSVASREIKFLNTSPLTGEKYFLTGGEKVGQVLIQYFCWRTMRCVVSSVSDIEKIRRQLDTDFKSQSGVHGDSGLQCRQRWK